MTHTTLGWTPHDGETVHIRTPNRWSLPAGRYTLEDAPNGWRIKGTTCDARIRVSVAHLIGAEVATTLTPISAGELERETLRMSLKLHAPLRGKGHRQHDASDLALFRAVDEARFL